MRLIAVITSEVAVVMTMTVTEEHGFSAAVAKYENSAKLHGSTKYGSSAAEQGFSAAIYDRAVRHCSAVKHRSEEWYNPAM